SASVHVLRDGIEYQANANERYSPRTMVGATMPMDTGSPFGTYTFWPTLISVTIAGATTTILATAAADSEIISSISPRLTVTVLPSFSNIKPSTQFTTSSPRGAQP